MLHIAEAMGFLALITRNIPAEIAGERTKIQAPRRDGVAEIAKSINPEAIAESLRQQFDEVGLRGTAALLSARAAELSSACSEFAATIHRLSDPDTGALPHRFHCAERTRMPAATFGPWLAFPHRALPRDRRHSRRFPVLGVTYSESSTHAGIPDVDVGTPPGLSTTASAGERYRELIEQALIRGCNAKASLARPSGRLRVRGRALTARAAFHPSMRSRDQIALSAA